MRHSVGEQELVVRESAFGEQKIGRRRCSMGVPEQTLSEICIFQAPKARKLENTLFF